MNTEKREDWYANADNWEVDFVNKFKDKFSVIINPSKEVDKFSPDLYMLKSYESADLKVLREPFYTSKKVYGINPQDCWTFNPSDFFDYSIKHSDKFGIFIWKRFLKSEKFGVKIESEESVYYVSLFKLKSIIIKHGKIHHYIRRMNDTNGNSYGSYGIDLRLLTKIL